MTIIRELLLGPRRFVDLRRALPQISANVLTERMRSLQERGIAKRERLRAPASVHVYSLTRWGMDCEDSILALGGWGLRSPNFVPTGEFSAVSLLLALKTLLVARPADLSIEAQFEMEGETFRLSVDGDDLQADRGEAHAPALTFRGAPRELGCALLAGRPIEELEQDGTAVVLDRREDARRLLATIATHAAAAPASGAQ